MAENIHVELTIKPKRDVEASNEKCQQYSLEDALKMTSYGKFHIFVVIASGLGIMGAVMENIAVSYILSYAKCDMRLTMTEQGLLNSVSYLGIVVSSHFWGFLSDTWGRRKVIRLTLICIFLSSLVSAFSVTTNMLIITRFLTGIFAAGVQANGITFVSEFHTSATGPRAASFASMFMPAVFIYMSTIAIFIVPMEWSVWIGSLNFTPWRLFLICCSSINILNFIFISILPESPKFQLLMNEKDDALKTLRRMYAANTGKSPDDFPVHDLIPVSSGRNLSEVKGVKNAIQFVWKQTKPVFVAPFLDKTVKLSYLMFVIFSIGHGSYMWFPDFLVQLQNKNESGLTLCQVVGHESVPDSSDACDFDKTNTLPFVISFGIGAFFFVLSGLISFYLDKIGAKKLICIWLLTSAACCASLNFVSEFYLIVGAYIAFLSCSTCAAIVGATSVNLFSTNIRAMATCCIYMFGRLGGVFGSNLVGILLQNNCTTIFYIFPPLLITCIVIFMMIDPKPHVETQIRK